MNEKALHQVKRAIIPAAGFGNRMHPLTLEIPKPLVPVNGVRMIESVITALHLNGIEEIYIVVGYLKEAFAFLPEKYPGVVLIDNPFYASCNNISSLYVAREHLADCIILDGDQIIRNPDVLSPGFDRSGYNAVWTDEDTGEWLLTVQDGTVVSCSRTGGRHGWQLYSISRWTEEDGKKLRRHLEIEFEEKKNRQIYWDDIALFCYPEEYQLGIQAMQHSDVLEIDSLEELATVDPSYRNYISDTQEAQT